MTRGTGGHGRSVPPLLPSGRQVELSAAGQTAVVVEVGGGLRDYRVGDRAVVDGYAPDAMATAGRGAVLVPWPNRLRGGSYSFDGRDLVLPLDEPDKGNASHGLARAVSWTPVAVEPDRVTMAVTLWPRKGWPFTLSVSVEYVLGETGLTVTTLAQNDGTVALPYALGHHPYVTVGTDTLDGTELHVPAGTWLPTDAQQIPSGREETAGSAYDFRSPRLVGDARLDAAVTDLPRGVDGLARAVLRNPADGREVEVWVDGAYGYLQLFSGDTVPEPERRRRSLAVEPMTAPPNALQTGEAVVRLEPGDQHVARWGITPRGW